MIVQKKCYSCEEEKLITEFSKRSGPKSQYRNVCKECVKTTALRRFKTDPEARIKSTERMRVWRAKPGNRKRATLNQLERNKLSPDQAFRLMICNARKRAPVDLTLQQLKELWGQQDGLCAITGIRMTWGQGRIESTSLSIDRLDSSIGYTIDNVRFVCHSVNCFRGRMSDDEMYTMALAIIANMKKPKLRLVL